MSSNIISTTPEAPVAAAAMSSPTHSRNSSTATITASATVSASPSVSTSTTSVQKKEEELIDQTKEEDPREEKASKTSEDSEKESLAEKKLSIPPPPSPPTEAIKDETSAVDIEVEAAGTETSPAVPLSNQHNLDIEEAQSLPLPASPLGGAIPSTKISTDSMVTVRLSDSEDLRSLPSRTPTLKLITDDNSDGEPDTDATPEPIFPDEPQVQSPISVLPEERRRGSVSSVDSESESTKKGVDWEELERTEEKDSEQDEESSEVSL